MGHGYPHAVADPRPPGNPLDPGAKGRQFMLRQIHHPIDGSRIKCRAFGFDPGPETGEHLIGIKGQVKRVGHGMGRHVTDAPDPEVKNTEPVIPCGDVVKPLCLDTPGQVYFGKNQPFVFGGFPNLLPAWFYKERGLYT